MLESTSLLVKYMTFTSCDFYCSEGKKNCVTKQSCFFNNKLKFFIKQLLIRGYTFYNKILLLNSLAYFLVWPLHTMDMTNFPEVEPLAVEESLNFFTWSRFLEGIRNSWWMSWLDLACFIFFWVTLIYMF